MKPAPILSYFIAPVLLLVSALPSVQTGVHADKPSGHQIPSEQADKPDEKDPILTYGNSVVVYLHGLMVGRYRDGDKKRFEVGMVRRAPDHKFMFNVCEPEGEGTKLFCEDRKVAKRNWVFEVRRNGQTITRDIHMYEPALRKRAGADRNLAEEPINRDNRDSRKILRVERENLHDDELDRFKRAFNRVFYFHNGSVEAKVLTSRLLAQRVDAEQPGRMVELGEIAEVVGVEIKLEREGDELVLFEEDNRSNVLWINRYKDKVRVEGRVLNLPVAHEYGTQKIYCDKKPYEKCSPKCPEKRPKIKIADYLEYLRGNKTCEDLLKTSPQVSIEVNEEEEASATHFQNYYYLVFKKDRPDRFELKNPCPICIDVVLGEGDAKKSGNGDIEIQTVPPYMCGMVMVSEDSNSIRTKRDPAGTP